MGDTKAEMTNAEIAISQQIAESAKLVGQIATQKTIILEIANIICNAFRVGNKVLLFGNGGSATDAQHIAGELAGRFYRDRNPLPAIALNTDTCSLTAIANDYGYEEIFSRQVRCLAQKGDIVIGISTSGNSANVLRGIQTASQIGAITVAFTGKGGKLGELADFIISVPSTDTPRIQEVHITVGHIICYLVEEHIFGDLS